jgi:hypothetical protein
MKYGRNLIATVLLGILLVTLALPLAAVSASADQQQTQSLATTTWHIDNNWAYIQNDFITIIFPAGGKKPMFLWWYTKDPNNIYVVKYKGLIEYMTFNQPYFMMRSEATALKMREMMEDHYYMPMQGMMGGHMQTDVEYILGEIGNLGLHRPFLPFSGSKWVLSGPENVTKGYVKYLSFNFTLVDVPDSMPNLQFAEGNIILRNRFYYTAATETTDGGYSYSVNAGELKTDLVIKHWEWNIDNPNLKILLQRLQTTLGTTIPTEKAGLALWVNMASINMTKLNTVDDDAIDLNDVGMEDAAQSMTNHMNQYMYVDGQEYSIMQNRTGLEDEHPMPNAIRDRFKLRFEQGNATFAGFFKFVPQALLRYPVNGTVVRTVDVTASYLASGGHLRLYISYPYFGNYELEHDPSLGLETVPTLFTVQLLIALLSIATIIAVALIAFRWKKGPVNVLKPNY